MFWRDFWRRRGAGNFALAPVGGLFWAAAAARRAWLARRCRRAAAPVIFVGSIVAGGGGKTPVTAALARALAARGYAPGVICRGVGGALRRGQNEIVDARSDPFAVGDEAVLLARQSGAPVAAGIDRFTSAQLLIEKRGCDVVIGDDGMQHYALARDFEICVVGGFGFGNRLPLPAGPLREPLSRLRRCDALALVDGASAAAPPARARAFAVETRLGAIYNPRAPERAVAAESFAAADTALLAGIADPESFFAAVESLGISARQKIARPDHCRYRARDLRAIAAAKIITTEKDAVKCERFDDARIFALPRIAVLPPSLVDAAAAAIEKARAARRIDR